MAGKQMKNKQNTPVSIKDILDAFDLTEKDIVVIKKAGSKIFDIDLEDVRTVDDDEDIEILEDDATVDDEYLEGKF